MGPSIDDPVRRVATTMAGFARPWGVAGGWAVDLWLGRRTRVHADIEVSVFREDQAALRDHLPAWSFRKVVNGSLQPWPGEEGLALPVHEIHARSSDGTGSAIEFLLNERDGDDWVFRRDRRIRLPVASAIRCSAVGVPILAPEIVSGRC